MICDHCHEREANVHITQVSNGETTQLHLCQVCAAQLQPAQPISVQELLSQLASIQRPPDLHCDVCGTTWSEFQRTSFLGCPQCYDTFAKPLQSTIEAIQGATMHTGRRPMGAPAAPPAENKMEQLKLALERAVGEERYEEAARLRDLIKAQEEG